MSTILGGDKERLNEAIELARKGKLPLGMKERIFESLDANHKITPDEEFFESSNNNHSYVYPTTSLSEQNEREKLVKQYNTGQISYEEYIDELVKFLPKDPDENQIYAGRCRKRESLDYLTDFDKQKEIWNSD
jgi:hypothetical protein